MVRRPRNYRPGLPIISDSSPSVSRLQRQYVRPYLFQRTERLRFVEVAGEADLVLFPYFPRASCIDPPVAASPSIISAYRLSVSRSSGNISARISSNERNGWGLSTE